MSEQLIDVESLLGYNQLDIRQLLVDNEVHFQGRSRKYNRHGELVKTSEWVTHVVGTNIPMSILKKAGYET